MNGRKQFLPILFPHLDPKMQLARDFRLASFKILSEGGGEVVVSMAKDSPLQNAKMWSEQVLQSDDEAKIDELANKVLAEAEDISAGDRPGKLLSIRASRKTQLVGG